MFLTLSVAFAECHYDECCLCWISLTLSVTYAECPFCWVPLCWVSVRLDVMASRLIWTKMPPICFLLKLFTKFPVFSILKTFHKQQGDEIANFDLVTHVLSCWKKNSLNDFFRRLSNVLNFEMKWCNSNPTWNHFFAAKFYFFHISTSFHRKDWKDAFTRAI